MDIRRVQQLDCNAKEEAQNIEFVQVKLIQQHAQDDCLMMAVDSAWHEGKI